MSIACLLLATRSDAQPASAPPPSRTDAIDPSTAVWISLGSTMASYGLFALGAGVSFPHRGSVAITGAVGALVSPSLGRWYAGSLGLDGLALRLGGIGSTAGGIGLLVKHCDRNSSIFECGGPAVMILTGVGLFFGGTFYDLGEVRHDAERHNARLTLLPVASPSDGHYGLALSGRF